MSTTIPALQNSRIRHGMLIKLTINGTVYTLANTYRPIVYAGDNYQALGHFLSINEIADELRTTNNSIQIGLSGIPKDPQEPDQTNYLALILQTRIKGSRVELYRIFFDPDTYEFLSDQTSLRFSGYISNYTLTDTVDQQTRLASNMIMIQCASIHSILERRITGRRTNRTDQHRLYPSDTSMDRVSVISGTSFDFGRPYSGAGTGGGSGSNVPGTPIGNFNNGQVESGAGL